MKIIHFCAGLEQANGMANTARQFVAEELARGDESALTNEVADIERMDKVDRVHIHGTWLPVLWKVAKIAKRKGAELIVRPCGNYDPIRIRSGVIGRLKKWLAGPFEHEMLDRADMVQCTCRAEVEWVKAYHPGARIQLTDLKRFFRVEADGLGPSGGTRKGDALHVLYLGRRHPLKGVEFLQRAVVEIESKSEIGRRTVALKIVSGHFGEELERDWEWCEVLCLPTLSENFGRVIAEAVERGKFVVTTDGAPAWKEFFAEHPEKGVYIRGFRDGSDDYRVSALVKALESAVA